MERNILALGNFVYSFISCFVVSHFENQTTSLEAYFHFLLPKLHLLYKWLGNPPRHWRAFFQAQWFWWYTEFCRSAWNHNACKEKKLKLTSKDNSDTVN